MIGLPSEFLSFSENSKGGGVMQVSVLVFSLQQILSISNELDSSVVVICQRVRFGQLAGSARTKD